MRWFSVWCVRTGCTAGWVISLPVPALVWCASPDSCTCTLLQHLGCVVPDCVELQEMICESCMKTHSFLWTYAAYLAGKAACYLTVLTWHKHTVTHMLCTSCVSMSVCVMHFLFSTGWSSGREGGNRKRAHRSHQWRGGEGVTAVLHHTHWSWLINQ